MKKEITVNGIVYIPKKIKPNISASNDKEAKNLFIKGYEPLCPQCEKRAFPTNFPPSSFGGEKNDKKIVWFCSDMGHCTFPITKLINWQKKEKYDTNTRK